MHPVNALILVEATISAATIIDAYALELRDHRRESYGISFEFLVDGEWSRDTPPDRHFAVESSRFYDSAGVRSREFSDMSGLVDVMKEWLELARPTND